MNNGMKVVTHYPVWLGRLICLFKGHLDGRAFQHYVDKVTREHHFSYACPRCGFSWHDIKRGPRA